jgi:septum formation inhibitor-activating ATPase MinD
MPVFESIPSSAAVIAAVNRGRPVVADRNGELDRAFRAFVDKATGAKPAATGKTA